MTTRTPHPSRGARPGATRLAFSLALALALLAATTLASIALGNLHIPPHDLWNALTGNGDPHHTAVLQSRHPRTALGILAGACLAVAGTLMQGVTRNPLADPGMLGINAGASATIVLATAYLGVSGQHDILWWSLPGALAAGAVVHLIGTRRGGTSTVRLVLAGAVLAAVLNALIQAVTLSEPQVFDNYRFWVVGSLAGRDFDILWTVLPLAATGLTAALALGRPLNTVALGDDSATALGAKPARTKAAGLLTATLLAAAATAATGPIAFVGLAVPHLVRALIGTDFRLQILFSLLLGPSLLLTADIIGRLVLRPEELMVGIVTAFVGAPALLIAVRKMRKNA
ncbi:FecCD family ABC transporter permease [Actinocorallia populi]|uniref:FecCD family ABC transporter permease n=1 Tax=Actinocorallia populi TaxID=2079200 RepID=UPI000D0872D4|nr:iron chelate uptake ABC transporter family permease subunit [Actinocorallia populi]